MICRNWYIRGKSYTKEEETELVEFCRDWLIKKRDERKKWHSREELEYFDRLSRKVLMLFQIRNKGGKNGGENI